MATSTGTTAPGGAKPPFPPFNPDSFASQILWFVIAFVALYAIISRLAIPRIGGILEHRNNRIANDVAEAGQMKAQADEAQAAYEKSLNDARARGQALAAKAREEAQAKADAARKALEADLNAKLAEAEKTIAGTKAEAMGNVKAIATDTAAAIVERLIGTAPAQGAVEAAVDGALKGSRHV